METFTALWLFLIWICGTIALSKAGTQAEDRALRVAYWVMLLVFWAGQTVAASIIWRYLEVP